MIVGSGGALSHAPRRSQSALMMLDSFQLEGITELTVDSIFMTPQLGVLSEIHEKAAAQVFERDCLVFLGTAVVPVGSEAKYGDKCITVKVTRTGESVEEVSVPFGNIATIKLQENEFAEIEAIPAHSFDLGSGRGKSVRKRVRGGVCGIIIDARGRPFTLPANETERRTKMVEWFKAMDVYDEDILGRYMKQG